MADITQMTMAPLQFDRYGLPQSPQPPQTAARDPRAILDQYGKPYTKPETREIAPATLGGWRYYHGEHRGRPADPGAPGDAAARGGAGQHPPPDGALRGDGGARRAPLGPFHAAQGGRDELRVRAGAGRRFERGAPGARFLRRAAARARRQAPRPHPVLERPAPRPARRGRQGIRLPRNPLGDQPAAVAAERPEVPPAALVDARPGGPAEAAPARRVRAARHAGEPVQFHPCTGTTRSADRSSAAAFRSPARGRSWCAITRCATGCNWRSSAGFPSASASCRRARRRRTPT